MLCIKKNKCFSTVLLLSQKKQTAYCNPFRPVETRSDLLKPVETRFNPFRLTRFQSVETRSNLLVQTCRNTFPLLHPPFSPLLPLFPFLLGGRGGGREGEGGGREGEHYHGPPGRGRGGTKSPPPLRILTTTTKNKILSLFLLQNLCNLPLPP